MRFSSLLAAIFVVCAATAANSHTPAGHRSHERDELRVAHKGIAIPHELIVAENLLPPHSDEPPREGDSAKAIASPVAYGRGFSPARAPSPHSLQSLTGALQSRWQSRAPPSLPA
jgi:hypothetical protein